MKSKKIVLIISIILIIIICIFVTFFISNQQNNHKIIDKNLYENKINASIVSTTQNESWNIESVTFSKTGDTSDVSKSDRNGLNAAVLVNWLSDLKMENSEITTSGKGANGVVATGPRAVITMSDSKVTTSMDRSKGILVSDGGKITANNLKIETGGYKSSAVATDFGAGNIYIKNSNLKTMGEDSVGFYATSNIVAENVNVTCENSEGAVTDGSGIIELTNVSIETGKKRGVMMFYTGPETKFMTTGVFKMTGGKLKVKEGPAFYVLNTNSEIVLQNVDLSITSGVLLNASIDEFSELGQEGGKIEGRAGNATLTLKNQIANGDVFVNAKSNVSLEISSNSVYTGTINSQNTGAKIDVTLDASSKWILTGDSYITSLNVVSEECIEKNGFEIYIIK